MPASWTPAEGEIVGGRYRLGTQIGKGAMGSVFRAEHVSLGSKAAVKVIDSELLRRAGSEELAELEHRFLREARAAASLESAHVVRVLDYGIERGSPYIAMELLEGESLADFMVRSGRIEPSRAFRILSEVGKAIARGHEAGIIHRDLKPENIFLARVDDDVVAKVLDFGIAKMAKSAIDVTNRTTRHGGLIGTPCYMSPEQITGKPPDAQADLWAIAVMAYESLVGALPFEATTVGGLAVQICGPNRPRPSDKSPVPPGFDAWWAKASSAEPGDRFRDVREALEALRKALEAPVSSRGLSTPGVDTTSSGRASVAATARAEPALAVRSTQATMATPNRPLVTSGILGAGVMLGVAAVAVTAWFVLRPHAPGAADPARAFESTGDVAPATRGSSAQNPAGGATPRIVVEPATASAAPTEQVAAPSASASAVAVVTSPSAAPSASATSAVRGARPSGPAPLRPSTDPRLGI